MITTICSIYLTILSIYHVITGILSFWFPSVAFRFYKKMYGCDPEERRQLSLIMKPWGALAIFAGICGGFAASNPARYIGVTLALWILLILRIAYRFFYRAELLHVGKIPPHRNRISILSLSIGVIILGTWIIHFWKGGT
jgi:hypothetical protein